MNNILPYCILFLLPESCLDISEWHMPGYEKRDKIGDYWELHYDDINEVIGSCFCNSTHISKLGISSYWKGETKESLW